MGLTLNLLGKPRAEREGAIVHQARGHKAWALICYLASVERRVTRAQVSSLLFADADDPLGALRWNLSEIRRMLGDKEALRGDDLDLRLAPDTFIDVQALRIGNWAQAIRVPGLGLDLLEGMEFASCPSFDAWLLNERRHTRAATEAVLREAALATLASNRPDSAIDHATRLVSMDPLSEEHQALLVRCYTAAGDLARAERQVANVRELFLRELGIEPETVIAAASAAAFDPTPHAPRIGPTGARALLDAGVAAVHAGALEAGLETMRRCVSEAFTLGDEALRVEGLVALGTALVHSGQGPLKEEGAAVLHQAIALTQTDGRSTRAATARRELAWLEMLAGRYERSERWLREAEEVARPQDHASILRVLAIGLSDEGRYADAITVLETAIDESADNKAVANALAFLGRAHLLRGEMKEARTAAEEALRLCDAENWIAFRAFPGAVLGEVHRLEGEHLKALDVLDHAFALGCQVADACYESQAARSIGLVHADLGDHELALERLLDARMRLVMRPDYLWMEAYALDGLCQVATRVKASNTGLLIDELEMMAARANMRDFLARAYLYRGLRGNIAALDTARVLAAEVQSPRLHAMIDDLIPA